MAYRLCTAFKDSRSIEVLVVFYGVAVLDDAFGAAVGGWSAATWSVSTLLQPSLLIVHTRPM
jgi:hypothetical protein